MDLASLLVGLTIGLVAGYILGRWVERRSGRVQAEEQQIRRIEEGDIPPDRKNSAGIYPDPWTP